jgi:hypothetical protein
MELLFKKNQTNKKAFAAQIKISTCASLNQSIYVQQILERACTLEGKKSTKRSPNECCSTQKMIDNAWFLLEVLTIFDLVAHVKCIFLILLNSQIYVIGWYLLSHTMRGASFELNLGQ